MATRPCSRLQTVSGNQESGWVVIAEKEEKLEGKREIVCEESSVNIGIKLENKEHTVG